MTSSLYDGRRQQTEQTTVRNSREDECGGLLERSGAFHKDTGSRELAAAAAAQLQRQHGEIYV